MGRAPRVDIANQSFHILNRANNRGTIFHREDEYKHFEDLLKEAVERYNMRLLAYVLMPNHWHLILYPQTDGDVSLFMQWLTLTHTQQYHAWKKTIGHGHIYQGRYKSFIIEKDDYLLTAIKYIARNPVRAKLAERVEAWRWGSGYRRLDGSPEERKVLSEPPVDMPRLYRSWVNTSDKEEDLKDLRTSAEKGRPFGTMKWTERMVEKFGLQATLRAPGRPKKS
jgi:putative transposase